MSLIVDGIKIQEIKMGDTESKSNIYIAKIEYNELNKVCKLGNVSINREVDSDRAEAMVKYIEDENTFYPTIVVATSKKNIIDYNEVKKTIEIKVKDDKDKFIVLDGQHRFKSIDLLTDEDLKKDRYQSVLIIENINNFQQRKIFIDINDTPRKVTTGTKLRFEKSITNYLSLLFIDSRESVLSYILMDDNQTSSNGKIPYKYIVKFNEQLISILNKNFKKGNITIRKIDDYEDIIMAVNNKIADIIEFSQKNDYQITRYELFYSVLGEYLSKYINKSFQDNIDVDINQIDSDLIKLRENLSNISEEFLSDTPKSQIDKKEKIRELFRDIMGE